MSRRDPLGLALGDFPPPPPGMDEGRTLGRFPNAKLYLEDPAGNRWIAHPQDWAHWRHWDKEGPVAEVGGRITAKQCGRGRRNPSPTNAQ
jgi:hypothetical protein